MDLGSTDAYISFATALAGALIGGRFTLKGATYAHDLALKKEEAADRERMITTLMLLRTEIATAWQLFKEECTEELSELAPGSPFLNMLPIGATPFPIFDSGPSALNLLPRELAKDVVHFYMRAKGVIAAIEMNNRDYEQTLQHARSVLVNHAIRAREQNEDVSDETQTLLFNDAVAFMAGHLGMGDTADSIRALEKELAPVAQRITSTVDELFFPVSEKKGRTS